jgi:hypothetical protein
MCALGKMIIAKPGSFWHQCRSFMRWSKQFWTALILGLLLKGVGNTASGQQVNGANEIAARFHFAGCGQLAGNTNFANLKKLFAVPSSREFMDLALDRLSASIAPSLDIRTNVEADPLARPLLDDLIAAESMAGFGGPASGSLGFVLAIELDEARAALWQGNIAKEFGTAGAKFHTEGFDGLRWPRNGNPFWLVRAKGWMLAGSGEGLARLRADYLQQISQHGRPGPALKENWLEADIDWPRLDRWRADFPLPLKPARTKINLTTRKEKLRVEADVIYPEKIAWQGQPWRVPTELVFDPLISFSAGNDVAPFLNPMPPLEHLEANPLTNQFCVWALGEMVLETYAAWPVNDASNALKRLITEAPAALDPALQKFDGSQVLWLAKQRLLVWSKRQLINPYVEVAPKEQGQYLLGGLFPWAHETTLAPQELWQQFQGRTNLVFYDWEVSGSRLQQWRLLSQLLPLLPTNKPVNPTLVKSISTGKNRKPPTSIEENWLADLSSMLGRAETVTEISRTAPNRLTLVRNAPIGLSSLEMVLLSHWLIGAGTGPIDMQLLPPRGKVSGPGAGH